MTSLSVLLPVYNAAPYLAEALNSLLQQTRQADQIIIINDGSTDHSLDLLQKFKCRESRVQLIDQENLGVSTARNRGLAICETEFIALMDADDICHPSRFSFQLEVMHKQRLDVCGTWLRTFGRKTREVQYPCGEAELKWNFLYLGKTLPNPTVMMRRKAIGTTRYREDMRFAEDFGFFLELLLRNPGIRMGSIPKVLLNYRTHNGQASKNLKDQNQCNINTLFHDFLHFAKIDATPSQIAAHYLIWGQNASLSDSQLQEYLPLMKAVNGWLLQHTGDRRQAALHWNVLAKAHRKRGAEAYNLILRAAGDNWPLPWRMTERLLSFIG